MAASATDLHTRELGAISPSAALKAFLIVGFLTTGQWTMLSRLGAGAVAVVLLLLALEVRPRWFESASWSPLQRDLGAILPGGLSSAAIAIGLVAATPTWWHLYLTRAQEFGFSGDDPYHFSAARAYALQVRSAGPALLALAAAVYLATRWIGRGHATVVFFVGLLALSLRFAPHFVFARYPATFYLLALPLNVAADILRWRSPWMANHITNALSIPAWLFLLRPLVVRRWPDLVVLPVVALLMFQKEVVYYFASGLLEPWAFVLWLTAAEAVLVVEPRHRWVALVTAAFAALIKETTVFLLPVIWLLSGGVDFRRLRLDWRAVAFGSALMTPFMVFYVARRSMAPIRTVGLASWREIAAPGRAAEFLSALHYQYGATGLVLIAILSVSWLVGVYFYRRDEFAFAAHGLFGLTALGLIAFFFSDAMAIPYTAYSRYVALSLLAAAATVLLASHELVRAGRRGALVLVAVGVLVLQIAPLASSLALDFRPDYARNSREWPHVPVYIPIRALVAQIHGLPGGGAVQRVTIVTYAFDATLAPHVYPDLNRQYTLSAEEQSVEHTDCRCRVAEEAILGGFEARTLLALGNGNPGDPRVFEAERLCLAQVQRTCAATRVIRHDDASVVGVLGVGVRTQ